MRGIYVRDTSAPESAEPQLIRARRAVILGSGGFEHNEQMRVKYQRAPITTEWTVGAEANTGDGILAAEKLGAALEVMEDAWWGPTVPLVGAPWFALSERNSPGSIIVNMAGKRFMNESMPYVEACHHMYGGEYGQGPGPGENIPAWLVFDQRYRDRYIFAGLQPGQRIPTKWIESGVIVKADTIAELAEKTGLPVDALTATVDRFNGFARSGVDEDFNRGESAYDRYYGDPTNKPNPNLGEISHAPYYAAKMVPGDLGTKGGVRTDVHGRALRDDGSIIEGLYAAGNVSSPVMGHTYPGSRWNHRPGDDIRIPCSTAHRRSREGDDSLHGEELMPINLDEALGAELPPAEFSWTSSDIQLYHLGLGAGADPMDKRELRYLTDGTPQVLPTFGNVAQSFHMTEPPSVQFPGIDIELSKVLHASEAVSAPGPIPPSGTGIAVTRFTDIWDKGKAAVIWSETTVSAPDGTVLVEAEAVRSSRAARAASAANAVRRPLRNPPLGRPISSCR